MIVCKKEASEQNFNYQIEQFSYADFSVVKAFFGSIHDNLKEKSHFIIADLEEVLPSLLYGDKGLLFGALHEDEIIAIQGMDFLPPEDVAALPNDLRALEIGWTAVTAEFRNIGLAKKLSHIIEHEAYRKTNNPSIVATVYPENIIGLSLYFSLGYIGYKFMEHLERPRIFLYKNSQKPFIANNSILKYVSYDDYKMQKKLFDSGYLCVSIDVKNRTLQFVKGNLFN